MVDKKTGFALCNLGLVKFSTSGLTMFGFGKKSIFIPFINVEKPEKKINSKKKSK